MNYSEDSRIDDFCRELALALRRITGLVSDTLPGDLPQKSDSSESRPDSVSMNKEENDKNGEHLDK
jgi:hypothetical protein